MIDVGQVARAMWRDVLPEAACQTVAAELGVSTDRAGDWVALWAGAHDLGKASPAFARQNAAAWERIRQAGFDCSAAPPTHRVPHGTITAWALPAILTGQLAVPTALGRQVGRLVGGHHGVFPRAEDVKNAGESRRAVGDQGWGAARRELATRLGDVLDLDGGLPETTHLSNATIMYLAGLVSVADWIGSNAEYFPYLVPDAQAPATIDWPAYAVFAAQRADEALRRLGWLGWPAPAGSATFAALFPTISRPYPVQQAVVELAETLNGQSLVVIEAPMGEGKTEAALYLADRWGAELGQRGVYVALPTQATSNQMFGRVRRFLAERHGGQIVNLQLLHGHAALSAELQVLRDSADRLFLPAAVHDDDDRDATVIAAEWFTARKRGLLAPFGVGTVDQALLAVLKTKHGFVRLFGLGHKTIVVDEVHAYDTYMTTLLTQLLRWLGALGASVVMLSATLPRARLDALVAAYVQGRGLPNDAPTIVPEQTYPRITWVDGAGVDARPVRSSGRAATIQLERLTYDLPSLAVSRGGDPAPPFEMGKRLAAALAGGGCAAVICTTVGRAQRTYAALERSFAGLPADRRPELGLFHARYRFEARDRREQETLARFGKPDGTGMTPGRPRRAVLVATQVIEQSLDLDFDLMVSELAPVDLLLQRIGRLHRHSRLDRPSRLAMPTLWLIEPRIAGQTPVFEDGQDLVYDSHILLRSWLALQDRDVIRVPDDVEPLVEQVYDEARPCPADAPAAVQARWDETARRLARVRQEHEDKARAASLVCPDYVSSIFEIFNDALSEDDPAVHPTLQALTRLGDPSIPVVLLQPDEEELADLGGGQGPGSSRPPQRVRDLLERSTTLTHRGLVPCLLSEAGLGEAKPPASWRRNALLRHHRLLRLDDDGCAVVGRYVIRLEPDLGILVETGQSVS